MIFTFLMSPTQSTTGLKDCLLAGLSFDLSKLEYLILILDKSLMFVYSNKLIGTKKFTKHCEKSAEFGWKSIFLVRSLI